MMGLLVAISGRPVASSGYFVDMLWPLIASRGNTKIIQNNTKKKLHQNHRQNEYQNGIETNTNT